jgi:penicillin-binding protein 1A
LRATFRRVVPRWVLYPLAFLAGVTVMGVSAVVIVTTLIYPKLPSLDILTDYRPKIPLKVYTADGFLIGEFGEERRALVGMQDVPDVMKWAILAAEDKHFYQHSGVNPVSIARAVRANVLRGRKSQGGSTITQQVAKNFFLSPEKTYIRKLYEILLSLKIENNLTKDQILELYINQISLGQRAYGFAAASQIYFGKPLKDVTLAEAAMLAGLPSSPSKNNPIANPKLARQRQTYVLNQMLEIGVIDQAQKEDALKQPLIVQRNTNSLNNFPVHAEFVAEMARQMVQERFPEDVYTHGFRVYTTILKKDQEAAYESLRRGVINYDLRHGYRGPEAYIEINRTISKQDDKLDERLQSFRDEEDLLVAVVLEAEPNRVQVYRRGGEFLDIRDEGLKLVARMTGDNAPANKRLRKGAVVRIQLDEKNKLRIVQRPEVEAAFISVDPQTGAVRALVGGFDFDRNMFNHATQAWRQPGSSFKPFIYSGSLEKGFTPATIVDDEPINLPASITGSQTWDPKNYDGKYEGPIHLRMALAKSKNMVSIRLLQESNISFIHDYITRFGFDAEKHPPVLTMALGAGLVTPWQMVTAYSVFANGGYRIQPYIVQGIVDSKDQVLAQAEPVGAGDKAIQVIDPRNAYLMDSMLRDVTIYGTAARATVQLRRRDLAGKTGTTNDVMDTWFCGYQRTVAACSWIGYDKPKKMGRGETGSSAALPVWIGYMDKTLKGVPQTFMPRPSGLVSVEAESLNPDKPMLRELIYKENVPPPEEHIDPPPPPRDAVARAISEHMHEVTP